MTRKGCGAFFDSNGVLWGVTEKKRDLKNVKSQPHPIAEPDSFTTRKESALQSPTGEYATSPRSTSPVLEFEHECFVDASIAADYLGCSRKYVLRLSRRGAIPAHPISFGRRVTWRYLLSELRAWVLGNTVPVTLGASSESGRRMAGGSPRKGGR